MAGGETTFQLVAATGGRGLDVHAGLLFAADCVVDLVRAIVGEVRLTGVTGHVGAGTAAMRVSLAAAANGSDLDDLEAQLGRVGVLATQAVFLLPGVSQSDGWPLGESGLPLLASDVASLMTGLFLPAVSRLPVVRRALNRLPEHRAVSALAFLSRQNFVRGADGVGVAPPGLDVSLRFWVEGAAPQPLPAIAETLLGIEPLLQYVALEANDGDVERESTRADYEWRNPLDVWLGAAGSLVGGLTGLWAAFDRVLERRRRRPRDEAELARLSLENRRMEQAADRDAAELRKLLLEARRLELEIEERELRLAVEREPRSTAVAELERVGRDRDAARQLVSASPAVESVRRDIGAERELARLVGIGGLGAVAALAQLEDVSAIPPHETG